MSASIEYLAKAKQYISANPFFFISKSWCPDCHYLERTLVQNNLRSKFVVLELDKLADQNEARQLELAFTEIAGRKWVPTIWKNGEVWGTERDVKDLERQGGSEKVKEAFK
ncbi:hypothetical protein WICPIJ_009540 [Wickerhamomyces pijperi]|uniref:Glutaredoxin domain-containing protein n=1 Tax=Wickerhamomyces pijperi TaxID=599730 RepID=A0A9P8PMC9_WICPI|nr:hypothetical protein WICPIJ_009540 [Wickerhamomyces pijperi]